MAIEYSGWIDVPRSESNGGGTVRIPFTFQSDNILTSNEQLPFLEGIFNEWQSLIERDYDRKAFGYGSILNYRFTSVVDLGFGPSEGQPHFGK